MVSSDSDASALDRVLFRLLLATFESDSPPKVLKYELDLVCEMLNHWKLPSSIELLSAHGLYHDDEGVATRTLQVLRKAKSVEKVEKGAIEGRERREREEREEETTEESLYQGVAPLLPSESLRVSEPPTDEVDSIRKVYTLEEVAEQEATEPPQAPSEEPMESPLEEVDELEERMDVPLGTEEAPIEEASHIFEMDEAQELKPQEPKEDIAEEEPQFDESPEERPMEELTGDEEPGDEEQLSPFEEANPFDGAQLEESIFEEGASKEEDVTTIDNALDRLKVLKEKYLRR